MEWENTSKEDDENPTNSSRNGVGAGGIVNAGDSHGSSVSYVKVMTDEQLETLRKQIAVYTSICEQLVDLHKTLSAQHDIASGGRLGGLYCDPLMASGGHKITARQRWTPTPLQLQILERIFEQGNGTPSKQKIKDITSELSQHGQISETNVYNWFQNRRARSKRKQIVASCHNNNAAESEAEVEVDSKTKTEVDAFHPHPDSVIHNRSDDLCFHSPEIGSELHFFDSLQNPSMSPNDEIFF